MTSEFRLTQVSMIMIGVEDIDRSVAFYRDKLGLTVKSQMAEFVFFDAGGVTLALNRPLAKASEHRAGATEVVFSVDGVVPAYEALRARGVEFIQEPRNVNGPFWASNFVDPDGHKLTLFGAQDAAPAIGGEQGK